MLELGEQCWSERESELVNCDDDADEPREMLLRELLLDDEARQCRRISDTNPENQTAKAEHPPVRARRQDSHAKCLHNEIERGYGPPVEAVDDKPRRDAPDDGSECRQADSPTGG